MHALDVLEAVMVNVPVLVLLYVQQTVLLNVLVYVMDVLDVFNNVKDRVLEIVVVVLLLVLEDVIVDVLVHVILDAHLVVNLHVVHVQDVLVVVRADA